MITDNLEKIVKNEQISLPHLRMNTVSDPRQVNVPNIVAIYGPSTHGKSCLGKALSKKQGFLYLSTDAVFFSHVKQNIPNRDNFMVRRGQPTEQFDICRYVNSNQYDHTLFAACLKEELRYRLKGSPGVHTVLLDGYVLKDHSRLFTDLGISSERTLVLHASIVDTRYMVERFDVTGYRYDGVFTYIRKNFLTNCINATVPKSRYQSFESLGVTNPNNSQSASDTTAKYAASHLDDVVRASDRFVDIGCNAGYFCFRMADKTNGSIVGVDMTRSWLEIASHINNSIFLRDNIAFFKAEALEFLSEKPGSFEIIHCASTYHYFRERQVSFLRAAHRALSPNGILVLEVELANTGTEPEITKRARGVDSTPCSFPNREMFLQQITELFQIEAEFASVFQKGSFYNRIYFHLRPIRPQIRFRLDKAQGNRISGWITDSKAPHQTIKLLIKINHQKEFVVLADRFRQDLLDKGIHPTGKCGFVLALPARDILSTGDTVSVLAVGDIKNLKTAPVRLLTITRVL